VFAGFAPSFLLGLAVSGAAPGPATGTTQFAFYHFHGEHIRVSVDGRVVFDRAVSVSPDNVRLGLAAVARIALSGCADVVVLAGRQRVAERICLTEQTRSIVVDGGPPLTIAATNRYQGED
jgi:hypothetical protein